MIHERLKTGGKEQEHDKHVSHAVVIFFNKASLKLQVLAF